MFCVFAVQAVAAGGAIASVSVRKPSGDPTSIKSIIKVRFLLLFPGGLVLGSIPPWADT